MSVNNFFKNILSKKQLLIIVATFVFLLLLLIGGNRVLASVYQDKFLPGTKVSDIELGSLSMEEARAKIDKRIDFVNRRGFVYNSDGKTVTINPSVSAVESGDSLALIVFWDIDKTLDRIKADQQNNKFSNLMPKLATMLKGRDYKIDYNWDKRQHLEILEQNFKDILSSKQDAEFLFVSDDQIEIMPESAGQTFNYEKALLETRHQIENLLSQDIKLTVTEFRPEVTEAIINDYKTQILAFADKGDLEISFEDEIWTIANQDWRQWLKLKKKDSGFYVGVDQDRLIDYLAEQKISTEIEVPVKNARFNLSEDGRVTEFVAAQAGKKISYEKLLGSLEKAIEADSDIAVAVEVVVDEPEVSNAEVNDLGIVEIIGTGQSDFAGSPVNRVHNINVGADTLHGILIKPGEEFSLLDALGEINGEAGYRQELVIKGDKTIPEYGGGLCQIGTTVFRATLASGLPVTQRRNHSYRVSYYEPAGTDATIYDPWPDYRFKNDTEKHVLIQTRIEGTKLYFDFWGTKDGRVAMSTQPEIYNIVTPPAKKIIKTTDIPVGTEKCTERAHNGADAKFDYSVQYPGQAEPVETTFYSHYIPWQEVCLLGVTEEELAAEQAAQNPDNASTTPEE